MFNASVGESTLAVGHVHITKHDAEGRLIHDKWYKNQITNFAKNATAQLWTGAVLPIPSAIQVGNGSPTLPSTGVDPYDTSLWSPISDTFKQCDFTSVWLNYTSQYSVTYQQSEAIGTWTEVGLFDSQSNLWSHVAISEFTKSSGETVTVQWQIQHLGN